MENQMLDPKSYTWVSVSQPLSPLLVSQRPALSFESIWAANPESIRKMFVSCCLTMQDSLVSLQSLVLAAESAWRELNFEIPEFRAEAVWHDGKTLLSWTELPSEAAEELCLKTFEHGEGFLEYEDLRRTIEQFKATGSSGVHAHLLFRTQIHPQAGACKVQLMLYVDHLIADGIGIRILLGRYLALLASVLEGEPRAKIDWTQGHKNLSAPWIQCLLNKSTMDGAKLQETRKWYKEVLFQRTHNPGLPFRHDRVEAEQQNHFIVLDPIKSQTLLEAVKRNIGPSATVTHLGHTAMVLAMLRAAPVSSSKDVLHSPCWLNGRRYIIPSELARAYVPVCMGYAPIVFSDLAGLNITSMTGEKELKEKLVEACKIATVQYERIRGMDADIALGAVVEIFETLGEMKMRERIPSSSSGSQSNTDSTPDKVSSLDPLFLSDGITEQYISHSYPIPSSTPTLVVDDVHFVAAAEQNMVVRMSSWRNQLRVSGEWSSSLYEHDFAIQFLQDIVHIMEMLLL